MRFRRGGSNLPAPRSARSSRKYHVLVLSLLFLSVVAPLLFLTTQGGLFRFNLGSKDLIEGAENAQQRELSAFEQIENMFPKEVINTIVSSIDDSGPLSLNTARRKDLSSSWVIEKPVTSALESLKVKDNLASANGVAVRSQTRTSTGIKEILETSADSLKVANLKVSNDGLNSTAGILVGGDPSEEKLTPAQNARRKMRMERKVKRSRELTQQDDAIAAKLEEVVAERTKGIGSGSVLNKYSIWRRDNDENSDSLVRLMRDQLIMARVYASLAQSHNRAHILHELRTRIRESQRTLREAAIDADLPHSASDRVKAMGQVLSSAREQLYDCTGITKKLRAMLQLSEEQARVLKKQSSFLSQLAAKTLPKGIHCLSMRLTIEYYKLPESERRFLGQEKLEDNDFFHYALFSDNVLAASVVVNSTIHNSKDPNKHVFHLVTDKLNYPAMRMWFLANPPGYATIDVQNIDDFTWLNSTYCPVLRQLESAAMKEYYFKADHPTTIAAGSSNLKYRNPKYLSMLNHLRFYLPEVYPKLDKILFLDDDIVVQKDLSPLWSVDLRGKVNGAVETCGHSFHRFDKYLNFSNPHIKRNFDPRACGWAYGMNMFDLQQWKRKDITGIYHKWQDMNEDRVLWKLGTLPPGLITFYNLTHPLEKSWHVLGLGYNPSVDRGEIENAAVVHYNGNMKPWLELAMAKYKHYWTRHVKYDHQFLQQCNIN
ncbi:hypothetical protein GOP47_0009055 [Adiantum capillus-veneris]|uniref:Hexosyltransferase n=1 Tax=Adiantum capillus-veneris TaxID=13818 RepID=A0A9D4UYM1_ADICA|nr:hypothetical protein GOP47_0008551 [Adiantum capillus-veneris]KAI5076990.1 hypothetical protein GOP47_0009055 [Adiantum capillus-veneris]